MKPSLQVQIYIPPQGRVNLWRIGRDLNPRWGCPHDGFQDRCIKPLCHLSKTVSRRSFKPTVLFAYRTCRCCSPLVSARTALCLFLRTRMQDRCIKPLCHLSKTVSPTVFQPTVLFAYRTCRCCSPLVSARTALCLFWRTRMQDRCIKPRLPPIQNCFPTVLWPTVLFVLNCHHILPLVFAKGNIKNQIPHVGGFFYFCNACCFCFCNNCNF